MAAPPGSKDVQKTRLEPQNSGDCAQQAHQHSDQPGHDLGHAARHHGGIRGQAVHPLAGVHRRNRGIIAGKQGGEEPVLEAVFYRRTGVFTQKSTCCAQYDLSQQDAHQQQPTHAQKLPHAPSTAILIMRRSTNAKAMLETLSTVCTTTSSPTSPFALPVTALSHCMVCFCLIGTTFLSHACKRYASAEKRPRCGCKADTASQIRTPYGRCVETKSAHPEYPRSRMPYSFAMQLSPRIT